MGKRRVGDYWYDEKKDELGEGTFGTVYSAQHTQQKNLKAAIKTINLQRKTVRSVPRDVLDRETQILLTISSEKHRNLVSLLSYKNETSMIYLVMEFCNGGDFRDYLEAKKTLKESVIRQFFLQIVTGLKFLHDKDIIHRDLKPENILLSFDGDRRYPVPEKIVLKIADFGLGRFLEPGERATTCCGTEIYMAPEILDGKTYDKKVDLWSIGSMIYECLVKNFRGLDFSKFKPPANASQEIEQLLRKLLTREPRDRFNCDQLLGHDFMKERLIQVSVRDSQRSRMITIGSDSTLDALIDKVRDEFELGIESNSVLLFSQGTRLEYGTDSLLEDCEFVNGSTLELGFRLPGGTSFKL